MTNSEIAAQLTAALEAAADRETGAKAALVSATIEMVAPATAGNAHAALTRKTKTLVFMSAEFRSNAGALIATASGVHKIPQ